jgi:hypothetical protein
MPKATLDWLHSLINEREFLHLARDRALDAGTSKGGDAADYYNERIEILTHKINSLN